MVLDRPARKQKPISLTPLVDVIFLLLLFFMLSSTFTTFGQVEIGAPAGSGGSVAVPQALLVLSSDGLKLNGREVKQDDLHRAACELVEHGNKHLLLLVRGDTTTQHLVTVMTELKTLPDLKLTVARN